MKKGILAACFLLVALSCNDKLWDEIDQLKYTNEVQYIALGDLRAANAQLLDAINTAESELNALINEVNEGVYANVEDINTNIKGILEANNLISSNASAIDSTIVSIASLDSLLTADIDEVQFNLNTAVDVLNSEISAIEDLADSNVSGLETLQSQIDSIQPIIVTNVTNVSNVTGSDYDDSAIQSQIDDILIELLCDDEGLEYATDFILPAYDTFVALRIEQSDSYMDECILGDRPALYEEILFAAYGAQGNPDRIFRPFTVADGWIGNYGRDYMTMDIEGLDLNKYPCYYDIPDPVGAVAPGIGTQLTVESVGAEADFDILFEFDQTTGEYIGCAPTLDEVTWYVNGAEVMKGANPIFTVGKLSGSYVITAEVNGYLAQHIVEKTISGKSGKVRGKVRPTKPVI